MLLWNSRSLVNKLSGFQAHIYSSSLDVIAITESWLTQYIYDNEILPIGYNIFRHDRTSARGGGVLIAVKNKIPAKLVSSALSNHVESVSVKILLSPPTTITCIYCPPNCCSLTQGHALQFLNTIPSEPNLIVGDFNCPDINWDNLSAPSHFSNSLCDSLFQSNLTQLISAPTHIKGNILDLVITNKPSAVSSISVTECNRTLISDHHLIQFNLHLKFPKHQISPPHFTFNYAKADYQSMLSYLLNADFSRCFQSQDVHTAWAIIKNHIYRAHELFIPKVKIRKRKYPKWYSPRIRHLIHVLHTTKKSLRSNTSSRLQQKLANTQSLLCSEILAAKKDYENEVITMAAHNKKPLYNYLKHMSNPKDSTTTIIHNSMPVTSDYEEAVLFNDYFNSTFTHSDFHEPMTASEPPDKLSSIEMSISDVSSVLNSLDPTKAMGCDKIGPKTLKFCSSALASPLTHLFTLCIKRHTIPEEWKHHTITPVFKSGDRSQVTNYRPISLLCSISKVLETIIYGNIIGFIRPKISQSQFGFLSNSSCLTQQLTALHNIFKSLDEKREVDTIYIDFSKAFDTVPHRELICKLKCFGIAGELLLWFQGYLTSRTHTVSRDGTTSNTLPVVSGVPQGSILGPLLFLIYVNDLPEHMQASSLFMFADDTKISKEICSPQDHTALQSDVTELSNWCAQWKLRCNHTKCFHIHFSPSTSNTPPTYSVGSQDISLVRQHRDLGIIISDDLSWSSHYDHMSAKAYKALGFIRRIITASASVSIKKALFISLVRSHLTFCSQIWRPYLLKDMRHLEQIQRRASKFILNDFTSDYKLRLINLNLLPLTMWFELQDIMFLMKAIKLPLSLCTLKTSCGLVTFTMYIEKTNEVAVLESLHTTL